MSRIGNTLNMLRILSTGRKFSIKELSAILEVSPRMIRQYKTDLELAGIYIGTIMGKNGGYYYNDAVAINQGLTLEDLSLAEKLRFMLDEAIFDKDKFRVELDIIIDRIRFLTVIKNHKNINRIEDKSIVKIMKSAIHNKRKLEINLKNNTKKKYSFVPLFYNVYKECYYFTGIVSKKKEMRTFSQFEIEIQ